MGVDTFGSSLLANRHPQDLWYPCSDYPHPLHHWSQEPALDLELADAACCFHLELLWLLRLGDLGIEEDHAPGLVFHLFCLAFAAFMNHAHFAAFFFGICSDLWATKSNSQ